MHQVAHSAIAQLGIPGGMELVVILAIAILLFGANKLPKLARSGGQAIGEFKRGRAEIETELREVSTAAATATDADERDRVRDGESEDGAPA